MRLIYKNVRYFSVLESISNALYYTPMILCSIFCVYPTAFFIPIQPLYTSTIQCLSYIVVYERLNSKSSEGRFGHQLFQQFEVLVYVFHASRRRDSVVTAADDASKTVTDPTAVRDMSVMTSSSSSPSSSGRVVIIIIIIRFFFLIVIYIYTYLFGKTSEPPTNFIPANRHFDD